jgi:hypothetical protein
VLVEGCVQPTVLVVVLLDSLGRPVNNASQDSLGLTVSLALETAKAATRESLELDGASSPLFPTNLPTAIVRTECVVPTGSVRVPLASSLLPMGRRVASAPLGSSAPPQETVRLAVLGVPSAKIPLGHARHASLASHWMALIGAGVVLLRRSSRMGRYAQRAALRLGETAPLATPPAKPARALPRTIAASALVVASSSTAPALHRTQMGYVQVPPVSPITSRIHVIVSLIFLGSICVLTCLFRLWGQVYRVQNTQLY